MATALAKAAVLPRSPGGTWSVSTLTSLQTKSNNQTRQKPEQSHAVDQRTPPRYVKKICLIFSHNYIRFCFSCRCIAKTSLKLYTHLWTEFPTAHEKKKNYGANIKSSVSLNHILSTQFHSVYIRKQDSLLPGFVITWHLTPPTITITLLVMASC